MLFIKLLMFSFMLIIATEIIAKGKIHFYEQTFFISFYFYLIIFHNGRNLFYVIFYGKLTMSEIYVNVQPHLAEGLIEWKFQKVARKELKIEFMFPIQVFSFFRAMKFSLVAKNIDWFYAMYYLLEYIIIRKIMFLVCFQSLIIWFVGFLHSFVFPQIWNYCRYAKYKGE